MERVVFHPRLNCILFEFLALSFIGVDSKSLDSELVKSRMAWGYPKYYTRQPLCSRLLTLEGKTKANSVGLWGDTYPTPPWEWRNGQKSQKIKPGTDNGFYYGNTKSKVFHRPDGTLYNCKNYTKRFSGRDDAIIAGYSPCGTCNP